MSSPAWMGENGKKKTQINDLRPLSSSSWQFE